MHIRNLCTPEGGGVSILEPGRVRHFDVDVYSITTTVSLLTLIS